MSGILPEADRDRRLRRLDWRFLLPDPRLAVPGAPADPRLRVARQPSAAELARIGEELPAGGACYAEWTRPLWRGAATAGRRLVEAGLRDVTVYWPCPNLERPWFWMPLASEAAREYVRRTRLPARNPVRRALDPVLRLGWSWAARAGMVWPLAAVGRAPGVTPRDELRARVEREWAGWGLGARPERLSWMLLTRGPRSISKVVGLVFAEPDPAPRIAVKLARVPESEPGLRREAAALAAVAARHPGGFPGVPRLLFCDDASGALALGETAHTGRPLFSLLSRRTYEPLALAATDWLVGLAAPLAAPAGAPGRSGVLVERVLREFAARFGEVADAAEIRQAERLLAPLAELPAVPEHRDFSPWNVHVAPDGGLIALDWESAEPDGLPLNDLVYFLAYLAFFHEGSLAGGRCVQSYRRARDPATPTGKVHQRCVARYVDRTGIPPSLVRALHAFTWLVHTRSDYQHMAADAGGAPSASALRGSLFLALWREELAG